MDTELLSKMLATLPCKNCYEFKLELHENPKDEERPSVMFGPFL